MATPVTGPGPKSQFDSETLINLLSKYNFVFDSCSKRIRGLPRSLRHAAEKEWKTMAEFYRPNPGDEVARSNFFDAVNNACERERDTPEK